MPTQGGTQQPAARSGGNAEKMTLKASDTSVPEARGA
jgi:hypothetical protein